MIIVVSKVCNYISSASALFQWFKISCVVLEWITQKSLSAGHRLSQNILMLHRYLMYYMHRYIRVYKVLYTLGTYVV